MAKNACGCMFNGCSALTASPYLATPTLINSCYTAMFAYCSSLVQISANFSAWSPTTATTNWVNGVGVTGDFYCPETLPETYGDSYIPTGWTKHDVA